MGTRIRRRLWSWRIFGSGRRRARSCCVASPGRSGPASGLDLPAREALLAALEGLAQAEPRLATILVSHHLEELPRTTSHALLLRGGAVVAAGPAAEVLRDAPVSAAFGI